LVAQKVPARHRLPREWDKGLVTVQNKGDMVMANTTAVKDLVCGMDVEAATAAGRTEYKGQTYYFCGSKCKEKFDLSPEQYLGKSAGTPKSGHGCCG
jgi:YHS domain-containing protein